MTLSCQKQATDEGWGQPGGRQAAPVLLIDPHPDWVDVAEALGDQIVPLGQGMGVLDPCEVLPKHVLQVTRERL